MIPDKYGRRLTLVLFSIDALGLSTLNDTEVRITYPVNSPYPHYFDCAITMLLGLE